MGMPAGIAICCSGFRGGHGRRRDCDIVLDRFTTPVGSPAFRRATTLEELWASADDVNQLNPAQQKKNPSRPHIALEQVTVDGVNCFQYTCKCGTPLRGTAPQLKTALEAAAAEGRTRIYEPDLIEAAFTD
jgi:hypothetical protein